MRVFQHVLLKYGNNDATLQLSIITVIKHMPVYNKGKLGGGNVPKKRQFRWRVVKIQSELCTWCGRVSVGVKQCITVKKESIGSGIESFRSSI